MRADRGSLPLKDGARIVIVGAGPAGSFFAHHALRLARDHGLSLHITICDGKNFTRQGPQGCNMCAGVISGPLGDRSERAGFLLPDERVQRRIDGYYLLTSAAGIALDHPFGKKQIRTVYRGNGPRFSVAGGNISFDDCLLDDVRSQGVTMIPYPVLDLQRPTLPDQPFRVVVGTPQGQKELEADLVVGACGLNTAFLEKVQRLGFGYRPPMSRKVCQAELFVGHDWIQNSLQNRIVVMTIRVAGASMAVLTPKAEHLTLTLMGEDDVKLSDLHEFLLHPAAKLVLPPGWQLPGNFCHCFPRLPVSGATRPFTDRLIMIGDASFARYYKNGIESAFITARLAAQSAFRFGLSAEGFAKGYLAPADRRIVRDNAYGRLLFRLPGLVGRSGTLAEAQRRVLVDEAPGYSARALRLSLWNILTGDAPYREIFWQLWRPRLIARLTLVVLTSYISTVLKRDRSPEPWV